jgi:dTDP-N-acetylfucosamine:lipid II N-acetylfucosaminyltransferase
MKLLHLVPDDKFIDMAIREFELVAPGQHEFVVLDAQPPYRYLKDPRVRSVTLAAFAQAAARPEVRAVVLHCMQPNHYAALAHVPADKTTLWIGWGYDYYGLLNDAFVDGLILPRTASLLRKSAAATSHAASEPVKAELSWARPYRKPTAAEAALLARIDYFSPVLEPEYQLARQHNPWLRARYLPWNYGTAEDDLMLDAPAHSEPGPNLLVGNSATPTNNHIEAFECIERSVDLAGRQLVVPLSYGDAHYARYITQIGHTKFGAAFRPLNQFMPKDAYLALLQSCGLVVMNAVRQQAMGNIYISALLGARLFMNRRNPSHAWLQSMGVRVDDVEQLDTAALTPEQRHSNTAAILAHLGRQPQRERTRQLVHTLLACADRTARQPAALHV